MKSLVQCMAHNQLIGVERHPKICLCSSPGQEHLPLPIYLLGFSLDKLALNVNLSAKLDADSSIRPHHPAFSLLLTCFFFSLEYKLPAGQDSEIFTVSPLCIAPGSCLVSATPISE